MKNFDLLDAIGGADDQFKQEVLNHMNNTTKGKYQRPSPARRLLRTLPVAAALICLLGVTAYAAVNYWGIFDFQRDLRNPLPSEAQELVQSQTETGSNDYVTCSITESITDGQKLYVTVQIRAKEPGKYFLMSASAAREMPLTDIGLEGEGTIGEYADANNLECIYVGADIKQTATGGTGIGGFMEKYQSPEVLDILIERDIADIGSDSEGICVVTANDEAAVKSGEILSRQEIPFTFTNKSSSTENVYRPVSQLDIDGLEIGEATVIQTELGTTVEFPCKKADNEIVNNLVFRRVGGADYLEGGDIFSASGELFYHFEFAKEDFGDSFTLESYDYSTDTVLGQIEFKR